MGRLLFFFLLFVSVSVFSQDANAQKPIEILDKTAEFPGGIKSFRDKAVEKIRFRKIIGDGKVTCEIKFTVETNGEITIKEIKGSNESFNNEVSRAVLNVKEKWSPAKVNGKIVPSFYRIPFSTYLN